MKTNIGKLGISALLVLLMLGSVFAVGKNQNSLEKVEYNKSELGFSDILKNFETVTVNPAVFKSSADRGQVKLKLLGKEFDLEIQQVQSDEPIIIVENGRSVVKASDIYTYKGKVTGELESSVLLTVADDVILGKINVAGTDYIIEQTNKTINGKVIHVIYTSNMIKKRNISEYNTDEVIRLSSEDSLPYYEKENVLSLSTSSLGTLSSTTVDILAGYDTEFKNRFSNPTAEISNMISSVNSAYSSAGVNLHIKGYKEYSNIQNSGACTVLNSFASTASGDRDSTNSDLAFLFSGKEFSGSAIGCGYQYTGFSSSAYAVAQMVSAGFLSSYGGSFDDRTILTAHETGHNFGANHQNSGHAYAKAYSWDAGWWRTYYTAMWTPYMGRSWPDYMQLEFSNKNNHGDSTHDNIRRISETKNTVAGFQ